MNMQLTVFISMGWIIHDVSTFGEIACYKINIVIYKKTKNNEIKESIY